MRWTNFHTHTLFSDGKAEMEEYVISAINKNMSILGFSEHAPVPFECHWAVSWDEIGIYVDRLKFLREKYKNKIEILLGLEIDYLPGVSGPRSAAFNEIGLDYRIGSVHMSGKFADGRDWIVDSDQEYFDEGLDEIFAGNIEAVVASYYGRICEMVKSHCPEIIGHFDLIKLRGGDYFDESHDWYRKIVIQTLKTVAQSKAVIEINTGGMNKGKLKVPYPSEWIIKECNRLKIPINLSADAHKPEHVCGFFEIAEAMAMDAGYRGIHIPTKKGLKFSSFDEK